MWAKKNIPKKKKEKRIILDATAGFIGINLMKWIMKHVK